jgi:hypothetical protein
MPNRRRRYRRHVVHWAKFVKWFQSHSHKISKCFVLGMPQTLRLHLLQKAPELCRSLTWVKLDKWHQLPESFDLPTRNKISNFVIFWWNMFWFQLNVKL